ncbi:MAG: tetratricopeptide repeat protein [Panacagrimonas sp.]
MFLGRLMATALCVMVSIHSGLVRAQVQTPASAVGSPVPKPQTPELAALLGQAGNLLVSGDFDGAYELLAATEADNLGNHDFNYLFGIAALESGRYGRAVFSLQRAVAGQPNFAGARLELARAYFAAGDNEEARREFARVAQQSPPAEAAAVIESYQKAIERRAERYRPAFHPGVEFGTGYDSNANSATDDDNFGILPLDGPSVRARSAYIGGDLSARYSRPLTPLLTFTTGAVAGHFEYPGASFVTRSRARAGAGLTVGGPTWQVGSELTANILALDGEYNQNSLGTNLSARATLSRSTALIFGGRYAQVRYQNEVDMQDVDQWAGGVSLQYKPAAAKRWLFEIGPVFGHDEARKQDSPYGRDIVGGQFGVSAGFGTWVSHFSIGSLRSDYKDTFTFPGLAGSFDRKDTQTTARIDVESPRVFGGWLLRPSLSYFDNRSDVSLFDYDRVEVGLVLSRDW